MVTCPHCGGRLKRTPRRTIEKLKYAAVYECGQCGKRTGSWREKVYVYTRFLFSGHARCLRCGGEDIEWLKKADKIDRFSANFLALFQRFLGAPIRRCVPCRLQFYDWRAPLRVKTARANAKRSSS